MKKKIKKSQQGRGKEVKGFLYETNLKGWKKKDYAMLVYRKRSKNEPWMIPVIITLPKKNKPRKK